jgi:FimV-like protein
VKTLKQIPADYKKLSDEELVFRYTDRHETVAISCLFERYAHLVLGLCLNYFKDDATAKKTTEEIFIRLSNELQRFKKGDFRYWLLTFVKTHCNKPVDSNITTEGEHNSSCLTRKQMEHYVNGMMISEEVSAVELHTKDCSFCKEAATGFLKKGKNAEILKTLNSDFLKEHFSLRYPQIHLNSLAASRPVHNVHRYKHKKAKKQTLFRPSSIAMIFFLAGGIFWYSEGGKHLLHHSHLNQESNVSAMTNAATVKQKNDKAEEEQVNIAATNNHYNDKPGTTTEQQVAVPIAANKNTDVKRTEDKNALTKNALTKNTTPIKKQTISNSASADGTRPGEETTERKRSGLWEIFAPQPERNEDSEDRLAKGDAHFDKKEYKAAINNYKYEMKSDDRARRHDAGIMAAQSYINLGEKDKAAKILQDIIDEGGPQKRAARKILDDLEEEQ